MEDLLGGQVCQLLLRDGARFLGDLGDHKEGAVVRETGRALLFRVHRQLLHLGSVERRPLTFQILKRVLQVA